MGGGGGGCNKFVPVLEGDGTKIAPTGDIFVQPLGGINWIRGKLADNVGDHVVLSPEGAVLVTYPGTESSYPRPPQSLNKGVTADSEYQLLAYHFTRGAAAACKAAFPNLYMEIPTITYQVAF